ncbi:SDR family oxidoreductase [Nesterenkonia muleiensis]|uniref:SDR family oxidoreductase n=1 Tax=Nesterenkonia muleiensis TaxID=2282648 RepID=UPI000E75EDFA|nr:SDR family oxidoreductase [Nesterenkonia muleiensis]
MPELAGRTALITGVGRREGIGYAVATRLAAMGASLVVQHHLPHDHDQPWGSDDPEELLQELTEQVMPGAQVVQISADLERPGSAAQLIDAARHQAGHVDILACIHARSGGDGRLADIQEEQLDGHWAVDARSVLMLTKHFATQHDGRSGGRVVWMTSGQQLGPMLGEVAYASAKAALAGVTATVAEELAEQGIVLNTVNPGPVNTGFLSPGMGIPEDTLEDLQQRFPTRRFGEPDDPARLIAWLVSDEGRWMVGQVLNTEGGFRRLG